MSRKILFLVLIVVTLCSAGCSIFAFVGAGAQAAEDQRLMEKNAVYPLEGFKVAVVIDTDMVVHYEHPGIAKLIAEAVAGRILENATDVEVIHPGMIAKWQFETPLWTSMPSSEIIAALQVDRVIYIDLKEYRLTPPGNQWLWEARCNAVIGIIEADSYEQDGFVETYDVSVSFPRKPSVLSREEANEADIERGLLTEFIKHTAWLFFKHEEPKHPDRYRPELES